MVKEVVNDFLKSGFNTVLSILVTISLSLGAYGLTQVVELKSEMGKANVEITNVKESVNEINQNVSQINNERVLEKEKLSVLAEKISNIDSSLKEIKQDLREALKNK